MTGPISSMPTPFEPAPRSASRAVRRVRLVAVLVLLVGVIVAVSWYARRRAVQPAAAGDSAATSSAQALLFSDSLARAPVGVRVRVRVLNATSIRGLARRATLFLRELGYDVVDFDGAGSERRDKTMLLSHTARDDWGVRLQRAMQTSTIEISRDSSRYVDFTVVLGRDWQPPTQPLRP